MPLFAGQPDAVYEIGERVQLTAYGLAHIRSLPYPLDLSSVGFVQTYKTPLKGVGRVVVRWHTGRSFPDCFDHVMLKTHIEPYGMPRA
jgi:hypothetical protein